MYQNPTGTSIPPETDHGYTNGASFSNPNSRVAPGWRNSVPSASIPAPYAHSGTSWQPQANQPMAYGYASSPRSHSVSAPGAHQWDPAILQRYAEFQLQQNHQRQQRLLLERQRSQLAEMGIPVDDTALLDHIFGVSGGAVPVPNSQATTPAPNVPDPGAMTGGGVSRAGEQAFEWPTVVPRAGSMMPQQTPGMKEHQHQQHHQQPQPGIYVPGDAGASSGAPTEAGDIPWGIGVDGRNSFLSTASPELAGRRLDGLDSAKRARVA